MVLLKAASIFFFASAAALRFCSAVILFLRSAALTFLCSSHTRLMYALRLMSLAMHSKVVVSWSIAAACSSGSAASVNRWLALKRTASCVMFLNALVMGLIYGGFKQWI